MRIIQDRPAEQRPRILGLTASVINCKIKKGEQVGTEMERLIQKLESCLGAKVCTSIDESIKKHEAKPTLCLESFKVGGCIHFISRGYLTVIRSVKFTHLMSFCHRKTRREVGKKKLSRVSVNTSAGLIRLKAT